ESWVSQVERGVRSVDRNSVLQKVADALSVPIAELRNDDESSRDADEAPEGLDMIRSALTGHPAIGVVLGTVRQPVSGDQLGKLRAQQAQVWELVHASRYSKLAPILANLIPGLESAARNAESEELKHESRELLADTYLAVAAIMSKLGEQ